MFYIYIPNIDNHRFSTPRSNMMGIYGSLRCALVVITFFSILSLGFCRRWGYGIFGNILYSGGRCINYIMGIGVVKVGLGGVLLCQLGRNISSSCRGVDYGFFEGL